MKKIEIEDIIQKKNKERVSYISHEKQFKPEQSKTRFLKY